MSNVTIIRSCPFCGAHTGVTVSEKQYNRYMSDPMIPIQDIFTDLDNEQREVIISGMCYDCQEKFFTFDNEEDDDENHCDGECDVCDDISCPANVHFCNGICDLCSQGDECPSSTLLEAD